MRVRRNVRSTVSLALVSDTSLVNASRPGSSVATMAQKRKRRHRSSSSSSGGGGFLSGMRGGMKNVAGVGAQKKESLPSKVLSYLLIAAAVAVVVYRFSR